MKYANPAWKSPMQAVMGTFFARAFGAFATLAMNLVAARILGASEAGLFFLSYTIIFAVVIISRFGMDNAMMRFLSPEWDAGRYGRVTGIAVQGVITAVAISTLLSVLLYFSSGYLSLHIFNKPGLEAVLSIMCFSLIPGTLVPVLGGVLKATRLPARAGFVEAGATPFFTLLFFLSAIGLGLGRNSVDIAYTYVVGSIVTAGLAAAFLWRRIPLNRPLESMSIAKLRGSAQNLMWMDLLNFVIGWSSSLFLGVWGDAKEVALFNVALRLAITISFILIVVNSIVAPQYASLYHEQKLEKIEDLANKSAVLMSIFTAPILVIIVAFPEWLLSFFGAEFTGAATLLIILAIAQALNVVTGTVGILLIMTGHEQLMRNTVLLSAVLSVFLNVVLIPIYGPVGAALSTALSLAFQNIIAAWLVHSRLKIRAVPTLSSIKSLIGIKN